MPVNDAPCCVACGADANLSQCAQCASRLQRGQKQAVCKDCGADKRAMESIGQFKAASSTSQLELHCNLCIQFEKRSQEDKLISVVGGPSPAEILSTIAFGMPWFLVLAQASNEEKLSALVKLKRKIDFTTPEREIAGNLANGDPLAAFLMVQVADKSPSEATKKTMEAYMATKVPSLKYKELLLGPRGSMDRARRHFAECMNSDDKIVAALAAERDFLCKYIESQCVPPLKRKDKFVLDKTEVPYNARVHLRFMFKSLSQRLKKASARNEADLMLMRHWYGDHMAIAHTHTQQFIFEQASAAASMEVSTTPTQRDNTSKRAKTNIAASSTFQKQFQTGKSRDNENVVILKYKNGLNFEALKFSQQWFKPNVTAAQAKQYFESNTPVAKKAFRRAFQKVCKNCYFAGRGTLVHTLRDCEMKGHPCVIPCPKCDALHWQTQCQQR